MDLQFVYLIIYTLVSMVFACYFIDQSYKGQRTRVQGDAFFDLGFGVLLTLFGPAFSYLMVKSTDKKWMRGTTKYILVGMYAEAICLQLGILWFLGQA